MLQKLQPMFITGNPKCSSCKKVIEDNEPGVRVSDYKGVLGVLCYECSTNKVNEIKNMMHDIDSFLINGKGKQWKMNIRIKRPPSQISNKITMPKRTLNGAGIRRPGN